MKEFRKNLLWNVLLSALMCLPFLVNAQAIPPRPNPPRLVNDLAGVLDEQQRAALEAKLVAYDDSTSNQVVVLTVRTLEGFPIEEYAIRVLREWGIGNQQTNNGVLIVAAIDDRLIRIETGYGLEGAIPDITANHIIVNDIQPAFRGGDYYQGFESATNSIIAAAAGEYQAPANYRQRGGQPRRFPGGLIILAIILLIMFSRRNRGGGGGFMSRRGYRRGVGPMIFPGGFGGGGFGGGGFGGGGFGGGGFGGFGGGSGGGGGASGSW